MTWNEDFADDDHYFYRCSGHQTTLKTTDEDATIKQVCRPTNTTAETHCLQKRNETVLTEDGRYFRATTLNGNGRRALMAHWRSLATHNTYLCPTV